ncbi:hypothetical protein BHS06_02595 [Myxococcus xanthus]|uniref:hypothetical protein n=1 Tax=Myxococcus xanthus TaxID=34 RepID=UPI001128DDB7|nr:hypothetical protein [Myxococcus xanthus]QDE87919.1 hypothetical protein BHS06_02595 [Myxococcus xanthus]
MLELSDPNVWRIPMVKAKTKTKASKQTKKLTQVLRELDKTTKPAGSANAFRTCSRFMYCV